jgi:hypothetical protein
MHLTVKKRFFFLRIQKWALFYGKYLTYDHDMGERCFYPSIDGLDAIYESYPNITFVNVIRNTEAWYESIKGWSQASLFVRLRLCNATGFPNGQSTKDDFMKMYDNFNSMIRQFVKDRPSITYIEVQLESNDTGFILEDATGIDRSCWKLCKPQERFCQENANSNINNSNYKKITKRINKRVNKKKKLVKVPQSKINQHQRPQQIAGEKEAEIENTAAETNDDGEEEENGGSGNDDGGNDDNAEGGGGEDKQLEQDGTVTGTGTSTGTGADTANK